MFFEKHESTIFLFLDIFEVKVAIYLSHFSFHGAIRRAFTGKKKKNQFFFSTHYLFTQLLLFCLKVNEYHMKIVSINTISSGLQWEVDLRYFFPPRKTVHQMDIRECYLMGIWSPFSSRTFFAVSTIFKIRDSHPMVPKAKKSVRAFFFQV